MKYNTILLAGIDKFKIRAKIMGNSLRINPNKIIKEVTMIFSAKYNRMLKYMLNDKRMKDIFLTYLMQLPESVSAQISKLMCNKSTAFFIKGLFYCSTTANANDRKVILFIQHPNLGEMEISFMPISRNEIYDIPLDNEYDIFLEPDRNIYSPAQFSFKFSKNGDINIDPDVYIWYNIVRKNTSGKDEYILVSQEYSDAGLYCTKVDINDFVTELEDLQKRGIKKSKTQATTF